jgi:hypothetical protein
LNARQLPIVAQTYFGVAQECLEGMVGQKILQKSGRGGRSQRETICDAFGENLVKATLPGGAGRTITTASTCNFIGSFGTQA